VLKKTINSLNDIKAAKISLKSNSHNTPQYEVADDDQNFYATMLLDMASLHKAVYQFEDAKVYLSKARSLNINDELKHNIAKEFEDVNDYIKNNQNL